MTLELCHPIAGRLHDRVAGVSRADARAGWMLGKMDGTVADIRAEPVKQQVAFFKLAKKRARETYAEGKLSAVKLAAGLSKRCSSKTLAS